MITLQQGVAILLDTINDNLRHIDYDRVTKIAEDYRAYVTGEGISEKLKRFNPRESEELFKQRKELTQAITPDIAGSCIKPMFKIGRAPVTKSIKWKNNEQSEKNLKEVEELANRFYGENSVNDYLTYKMVNYDSVDPNAFLVVEFKTEDGKNEVRADNPSVKAIPYPFEVTSKEAINYRYINNVLQWLIVRNEIMIKTSKENREGEKLTIYLDNNTVTAVEIDKSLFEDYKAVNNAEEIDIINENTVLSVGKAYVFTTRHKSKKRFYGIRVYEHKLGFNPAKRFGTIPDLTTNGRTCVPLIHLSQPYLEKSIKTMSEFDLTNCLHTFPQKIQYSDPCPGHQENDVLVGCVSGMTPAGKVCKACNGSGYKYHQSSQDMIQIRMPKDLKEMISLENVIAYKYPPIELLEFQKKFGLYELRYFANKAVYNSELFSQQDVTKTATEKVIDLDSVYDTLTPFANNYSAMMKHVYRCIIGLRFLSKDLEELTYSFPKDFKMKPYTMLLEDLKKATDNGAPSHVKKAIIRDITEKLYVDNPREVLKITTKEKYFPFTGKTETEIAFVIANDLTTKYNKILYSNFESIFSDLEYDLQKKNLDFYMQAEDKQRELITAKVEEYTKSIEEDDSEAIQTAFNGATGNEGAADSGGQNIDTGNGNDEGGV